MRSGSSPGSQRSPSSSSGRLRSASAPTRPSSRSSTASCCAGLPVEAPERLARLVDAPPSGQQSWTYPIWQEIQRHADLFDGAFAWSRFDAQFNLTQGGETRYTKGVWASGGSFDVLGVRGFEFGRLFVPSDDRTGGGDGGPVAVISHAFWQEHFGGAADVIGGTLSARTCSVDHRGRDAARILWAEPRGGLSMSRSRSAWNRSFAAPTSRA